MIDGLDRAYIEQAARMFQGLSDSAAAWLRRNGYIDKEEVKSAIISRKLPSVAMAAKGVQRHVEICDWCGIHIPPKQTVKRSNAKTIAIYTKYLNDNGYAVIKVD